MEKNLFGIVVPGGNAPGINEAIWALYFAAMREGWKGVVGFHRGFELLSKSETPIPHRLQRGEVEARKWEATACLELSRLGAESAEQMQNIAMNLQRCGVSHLVAIGGDGTARATADLVRKTENQVAAAVLLKSIDGFGSGHILGHNSAASEGALVLRHMLSDARAYADRGFILQIMGRETMVLAFAVAASVGAMALGPELFPEKVRLEFLADLYLARILKRRAQGAWPGCLILAEALTDSLSPEGIAEFATPPKDYRGRTEYSQIPLGPIFRQAVVRRAREGHGVAIGCADDNIGYQLRGIPANGFDCRLAQLLAVETVRGLGSGLNGFMVSQNLDRTVCIEPLMTEGGEVTARPRGVDLQSAQYKDWVYYMDPLAPRDLQDLPLVHGMARLTHYAPEKFVDVFGPAARFNWFGR